MVTAKKIRLVNPQRGTKKRVKRAPRKARKTNPGPLFVLGAVNPHKGANKVAKTAKKRKKNAARRPNPFAKVRAAQKRKNPTRRRRNPDMAGMLAQPVELLKFGLVALLGLVATRQVPQMLLGARNTGLIGYASNLGTALAGAYGTGKFAGNRAAIAFGTGGGLYTVNRILTDKLTPVGQVLSLAGVGDAHASNSLGRLVPGAIFPPSYDEQGRVKFPPVFADAVRRLQPPPAAGAPAGSMSGFRGSSRIKG
jgi:hypothetical protein